MLWTTLVSSACLVGLLLHYFYVAGRRIILGPETYLLLLGTGTYISTAVAAAREGVPGSPYVLFIGASLTFFILGTVACRTLFGFRHRSEMAAFVARPWEDDVSSGRKILLALALGILGLLITAAYYHALGYFVPLEALGSYLRGGTEEMRQTYATTRVATTRGTYLGLGYVMQFKDCILPLVTFLLYFRMRAANNWPNRLLFFFFLAASVIASVGHGARGELAYFGAVFVLLSVARFMSPWNLSKARTVAVFLVVLVLLSSLTFLMGPRGTGADGLLWAPVNIFARVTYGPAIERFQLYRLFLQHKEPQWGIGVLRDLQVALPGRVSETLSSSFALVMYGTAEGDMGLDLWGTLWHEAHFFGIAFAFLLGFLFHYYYIRLLRGTKSLVRVVTLSYAGFVLGTVGGAYELLIKGFLTLLVFLWLAGFVDRHTNLLGAAFRRRARA